MQNLGNESLSFLLKFIFELTIAQRYALSQGSKIDDKILQLIHTASSCGISGQSLDEFLKIVQDYSENNPDLKQAVNYALSRATS